MFNLSRRRDEDFANVVINDIFPELKFAMKLKAASPKDPGLDLLREKYRKNGTCPRLEEYKRASKQLKRFYDETILPLMIDILYT